MCFREFFFRLFVVVVVVVVFCSIFFILDGDCAIPHTSIFR